MYTHFELKTFLGFHFCSNIYRLSIYKTFLNKIKYFPMNFLEVQENVWYYAKNQGNYFYTLS